MSFDASWRRILKPSHIISRMIPKGDSMEEQSEVNQAAVDREWRALFDSLSVEEERVFVGLCFSDPTPVPLRILRRLHAKNLVFPDTELTTFEDAAWSFGVAGANGWSVPFLVHMRWCEHVAGTAEASEP